ncbi:ankyrin repeat and SOCS box protein 7-like [Acropora palmata]|uniref:ankyrin repeat and SOCS box protein 7-like n=1 Tax=Acropora palmata TaxID=6131 RepID=UPI003DA0BF40
MLRKRHRRRERVMENPVNARLREAVATGNVKVVRERINEGASTNHMDANGWTLLHLAASRGKERVLRVLLEKGGDAFARDFVGGFTALHYAAMHGRTRIAKLLLDFKGLDKEKLVDARSEDGWTPLHVAAHYGRDSFVQLLLESKGYVDALSDKGTTALQLAIIRERTSSIKVLLNWGANIDVQFGFPLRYAVIKANVNCVRMLVEHGALTSIKRPEDGQTPLHLAALRNSEPLARLLCKFGADIHAFNDEGLTPLAISQMMFNVNSSNKACLDFLISVSKNPRSLQESCRFVIRDALGAGRLGEITRLPVPNVIKDFILYKCD